MYRFSLVWRIACLTICVFVLTQGLADHSRTPQRVHADEKWRSIPLPTRPLYIASNADTFWICGTDEMIAKSSDGGQTWQTKHLNTNGEVLLQVGFLSENTAYAAGTNGLILWTRDGGDTWSSIKAGSETILEISFGDDKHGIKRTRSTAEMTRDGGTTWTPIPDLQTNKELEKFKIVSSVAALGPDHSAILLKESPFSDQIFLVTIDGGKTWKTKYIGSSGIRQLTVKNGEYWALGYEVIEKDKPGGGYGVPLALHSANGIEWLHGVRSPKEFYECTAQGCILWDGAIVDVFHEKPAFWAVPADHSLTPVWAFAKGSICTVGSTLECVTSKLSDVPQPKPETKQAIYQMVSWEPPAPGCVACNLQPFGVHKDLNWNGTLNLEFLIGKNGTVAEVKMVPIPPSEIESSITKRIKEWVFEPTRKTSAETSRHTTMSVTCYAFSDHQEGSCSFHPGSNELKSSAGRLMGLVPITQSVSPKLRAEILHLFEVMHLQDQQLKTGRAVFESMRPMVLSSLPVTASREKIVDAYLTKILDTFKSDELIESEVAAYGKYFSSDDITELIKFLETSAGQHFLDVSPKLTAEQAQLGQQLVINNLTHIFKELCDEYPELQGEAKFCPASKDKKSLLVPPDPLFRDLVHPGPLARSSS